MWQKIDDDDFINMDTVGVVVREGATLKYYITDTGESHLFVNFTTEDAAIAHLFELTKRWTDHWVDVLSNHAFFVNLTLLARAQRQGATVNFKFVGFTLPIPCDSEAEAQRLMVRFHQEIGFDSGFDMGKI